ncbi:MAG: hypothetical protein JSS82_17490 [Bacteroidetes bacterium]|nr:hypothetical protein [Bacteroidota bacterium]
MKRILLYASLWALTGCSVINKTAKFRLNDGVYRTSLLKPDRVYVSTEGDTTIAVEVTSKHGKKYTFDTSNKTKYTPIMKELGKEDEIVDNLYQPSFDVDVLTIPFKYRPATRNFPNQLNVTYNGAVYVGYRTDKYQLNYERNPLDVYTRKLSHFGLSAGLILGLGSTDMNQYVTENKISIEYEGLVFIKGLGITAAVENLNFGITVGTDHLFDRNHIYWIYQNKLWLGLAIGLNIN